MLEGFKLLKVAAGREQNTGIKEVTKSTQVLGLTEQCHAWLKRRESFTAIRQKTCQSSPAVSGHTSPWIQTCHLLTHCMRAQQFISGCIMLAALVTEACWKLTLDTFLGFEYHASSPLSSYWLLQGRWVKNKEKETQYRLQKDFFFYCRRIIFMILQRFR